MAKTKKSYGGCDQSISQGADNAGHTEKFGIFLNVMGSHWRILSMRFTLNGLYSSFKSQRPCFLKMTLHLLWFPHPCKLNKLTFSTYHYESIVI